MKKKLIISTLILFVFNAFITAQSSISIYELRCEYLENPLGLQIEKPRFSWKLDALNLTDYGQCQTAYRLLVSQTKESLQKNKGDIWDSKWIKSDQAQHIVYEGVPLHSDRTYFWKVQVKDEQGKVSNWSEIQYWNTGNFNKTDWTAQWIGSDQLFDRSQSDCNIWDPWLRKSIVLLKKPAKAIIFVASVGFHELYVNGAKVSEDVLSPLVNDHVFRASYIGYDIAPYLHSGENVIALWLGTSWSIFTPYRTENRKETPMVLAQVDVFYEEVKSVYDKPSLRIETDATWKVHSSESKLIGTWTTGNMGGELIDANKKILDWNQIRYNDNKWDSATVYTPELKLSSENAPGNRLLDPLYPVAIEEKEDGSYRVDMGVNFAGWTQIKVKGDHNDRIEFNFSEREQSEMTFAIRSAYIIGESGQGIFKNRFNYSSGRWITIRGLKEKPKLTDITGWLVRTNYETATQFQCSDPLQNWIYDRTLWTYENLSLGGYIVDCPQRERLGYGGDAHATSETGLLNYKLGSFYTKWMQDWRDVQGWEPMDWGYVGGGTLPHTAPTRRGGGGPAWGGICISLPWFLYEYGGDMRILEDNFQMMKDWLIFLDSHTKDNILVKYGKEWDFLGDWLWPNATAEGMNNKTPQTVCFNSCFYIFNLRTAAKIAKVIGKTKEAEQWEEQATLSSKAVHEMFFNEDDNSYSDRSMANLAAALIGEVPPVDLRNKVIERLEKEILEVKKGHIHVGITGGAMLFKVLRDLGRDDLIYSMTSQTDYPSWGYMRDNGATTIWEMWEKDLPGHSLLHSSYLYPGAWYVDGVAGIRKSKDIVGFKEFIIRPPLLKESQISWAKASYDSPVGVIKLHWEKKNNGLYMKVTVPANSKAIVYFPSEGEIIETSGYSKTLKKENGYTCIEIPAGSYTFIEN